MSVGIIKPNISKGLITITCGLLLSLPIVASADQILTDSISDQTPVSDSQLRLQAYINQMMSDGYSETNMPNISTNDKETSSITPNSHSKDIASTIRHNFIPPVNSARERVKLTIRLDEKGNVLSASASGSNERLNQAAIRAAWTSSPLPIDLDNPNKYSYIIVNFQTS